MFTTCAFFRPVEKWVGRGMATLGALLGAAAVMLAVRTAHPVWAGLGLVTLSLAVGATAAGVIYLAYRILFSDGVERYPGSGIFSPQNYGGVAWRHFFRFARYLVVVAATTSLVEVPWR